MVLLLTPSAFCSVLRILCLTVARCVRRQHCDAEPADSDGPWQWGMAFSILIPLLLEGRICHAGDRSCLPVPQCHAQNDDRWRAVGPPSRGLPCVVGLMRSVHALHQASHQAPSTNPAPRDDKRGRCRMLHSAFAQRGPRPDLAPTARGKSEGCIGDPRASATMGCRQHARQSPVVSCRSAGLRWKRGVVHPAHAAVVTTTTNKIISTGQACAVSHRTPEKAITRLAPNVPNMVCGINRARPADAPSSRAPSKHCGSVACPETQRGADRGRRRDPTEPTKTWPRWLTSIPRREKRALH